MSQEVIIAGVPASFVIMSLVQVAKYMGMSTRFAPLLSVLLGVVVTVSVHVVGIVPGLRAWFEIIGAGVMLGLAACGLFSGSKAMLISTLAGSGNVRETSAGKIVESAAIDTTARVVDPPAHLGPGGKG